MTRLVTIALDVMVLILVVGLALDESYVGHQRERLFVVGIIFVVWLALRWLIREIAIGYDD